MIELKLVTYAQYLKLFYQDLKISTTVPEFVEASLQFSINYTKGLFDTTDSLSQEIATFRQTLFTRYNAFIRLRNIIDDLLSQSLQRSPKSLIYSYHSKVTPDISPISAEVMGFLTNTLPPEDAQRSWQYDLTQNIFSLEIKDIQKYAQL